MSRETDLAWAAGFYDGEVRIVIELIYPYLSTIKQYQAIEKLETYEEHHLGKITQWTKELV